MYCLILVDNAPNWQARRRITASTTQLLRCGRCERHAIVPQLLQIGVQQEKGWFVRGQPTTRKYIAAVRLAARLPATGGWQEADALGDPIRQLLIDAIAGHTAFNQSRIPGKFKRLEHPVLEHNEAADC